MNIATIVVIFFIALIALVIFQASIIKSLKFSKQSQSVKYGQMSEQFMPFLKEYPYNSQEFKFIGKPIDGIQFENDKIIFIEFKTNSSRMSEKQINIKKIIEEKEVYFKEVRI